MRASLLWTATAAVEGSNVVVMVALTKCNFLEKRFVLIFFYYTYGYVHQDTRAVIRR